MRAAIYEKFGGSIKIDQVPDPEPSAHGVVIKVMASGLCLSDWHGWMGHDPDIELPHVPGHELAGIVIAKGKSVKKWAAGQRVTVPFVGGCGHCRYCNSGNQQVCDNQFQPGFTAWGSFAEYVAIDYADENLVLLPGNLDFTAAASLGCRFITAYRAIKHQGKLLAGQYVAVHGCGGVGLSAIQIAAALGGRVIAVDISDEKCMLAKELGAAFSLNANSVNVPEAIREISRGGVDLSIDALGHTDTCLNSILSLKKRGKHVQVGLMTGEHNHPAIPMPLVIANELEILGSHGMQAHKYPEMFELVKTAGIDLNGMLTRTIGLDEVPESLSNLNRDTSAGITALVFDKPV
ncbi:zinc-dependent alcohol dehydrogenase family protein [Poritiphilus flavus]|uniref:Alcohol dehydrogenase catalytic domain-containing protein n=1 Tax=Poritiphilus flavus TaxID=2697053 RepID=A0A6L9EF12_9FLAO|nr:zinc-dependent alcohol dehydrogenase family protein [Poritiphilus flavus]NAS13261.1 alcohol dehydrogenase catalytic domain-containing protein [Poritiphilus flavus]